MIKATAQDAKQLMHNGILALGEASQYGMKMDTEYCEKTFKKLTIKIKKKQKRFWKTKTGKLWKRLYPSPNMNSDTQLRDILFNQLNTKSVKKTKKGGQSVDNTVLTVLVKSNPDLNYLLDIRKIDKVCNTYILGFLNETVDGLMHPFFHLHTVVTYRSSSADPNFQNLPNRDPKQKKLVRRAIIPRQDCQIATFDFGGIEVGKSCCCHKDPKMIHDYIKGDMHRDMAIELFKLDEFQKKGGEKILRKGAKNGFVFPQFYGDYYGNNAPVLCDWADLPINGRFKESQGIKLCTGKTIGEHLLHKGIKNYKQFVDHVQKTENRFWNERYTVYRDWKKNNVKQYLKKGFLKTLTGFTCSGLLSANDINNYPIQSIAFHSLLRCFIEVSKRLQKSFKTRLFGQIHDEMVANLIPSEKEDVMEMIRDVCCVWLRKQCPWIIVPMEIEAGIFGVNENWATEPETIVMN